MKTKSMLLLMALSGLTLMLKAQDYYPMEVGREWAYTMFNELGEEVGIDTVVCESTSTSGDTTFYHITEYQDSTSGGTFERTVLSYNGISDANLVFTVSPGIDQSIFKHEYIPYIDNPPYQSGVFITYQTITPHFIGDLILDPDTFHNCFYLEMSAFDSSGFIVAPNVGIVQSFSEGTMNRQIMATNFIYDTEIDPPLVEIDTSTCLAYTSPSEKYTWTESGNYFDTIPGTAIYKINLTIMPLKEAMREIEICEGDSILIGDTYQKMTGTFYDTIPNEVGCDSVYTIMLSVGAKSEGTDMAKICEGDSIMLGGAYQTQAGVYYDTLINALGCDSVIATTLEVSPTVSSSYTHNICVNESYNFGGTSLTQAGTYYDTLSSENGCDSIVTLTLTVTECITYQQNPIKKDQLIYPVPTTNLINIALENLERVEVYSISGKLLKTSSENQIELSSFHNGIYYLRIITADQETFIQKIIISK